MKVFIVNFSGVWLGGEAVIVAETKRKAFNKLKQELSKQSLGDDLTMDNIQEVDISQSGCYLLDNGDY